MPAGLQIWNESGALVLDTNDRIVGDVTEFSTGTSAGSYTATPESGQSVEFIYTLPNVWLPSGRASRWPSFSVSGNTITWSFQASVPTGSRAPVSVMEVRY